MLPRHISLPTMLITVAALGIISIAGIGYIHYINASVVATEREDIEYLQREAPAIYDPILSSGGATVTGISITTR